MEQEKCFVCGCPVSTEEQKYVVKVVEGGLYQEGKTFVVIPSDLRPAHAACLGTLTVPAPEAGGAA